jgi:2-oxoglutarate dehydrogenase E2 component (dihydrolipoamide succinyltransferase)
MTTEVKVPTLGESLTEATLGQWLKKPGEAVAADEAIASLETDKVAIEVTAPVAGVMGAQLVLEGATVNVGAVIAGIEAGGSVAASAPAPAAMSAPVAEADEASADLTLSPAVRRLVLERGLDPSKIKGTGKDGRLTKEDVLAAASAPAPVVAAAPVVALPLAVPSNRRAPPERGAEYSGDADDVQRCRHD